MPTDKNNGLAFPAHFSKRKSTPLVKRDAAIKNHKGDYVFRQDNVKFPENWEPLSINVVTSKYFYGDVDADVNLTVQEGGREQGVDELINRVVSAITSYGVDHKYFNKKQAVIFEEELRHLCIEQYLAFNSPVWFNVGLNHMYGISDKSNKKVYAWDSKTDKIKLADPYERPQASACFIISVEDSIDDIWQLMAESARLFKYGSGVGADWSTLRSSKEKLSGGGQPSGPVSFMRVQDATGGTIKSGGKCLAPHQKVYTAEHGPIEVQELDEKEFTVLSYHPPAGRVMAKKAQAWKSGQKEVVRVTTDKGVFETSFDHPFLIAGSRENIKAQDLKEGMRLLKGSVYQHNSGYIDVWTAPGKKELLHRLVAQDVLKLDISNVSIHHKDQNKLNCSPNNLEKMDQSYHASLHGKELAEKGQHVFQSEEFKAAGYSVGVKNGMHKDSQFWQDEEKAKAYRKKKSQELKGRGSAKDMQVSATVKRYLNTGWEYLNEGHDISTEDKYRDIYFNKLGRKHWQNWERRQKGFVKHFGSYKGFLTELDKNNHKVLSVEPIGVMDVYSVEVYCDTPDDKSPESGHNFLAWSNSNENHVGTGVFLSNTRRAAIMQTLRSDHPDVEEFINAKSEEEKKAWALIEEGYDGSFNGPAYGSVDFQNVNQSVRADDKFMQAVIDGAQYDLLAKDGTVIETVWAQDLMRAIAEGTHICGDPGMQFDDIIQSWHTVPNTGRINSSNPCSEYLHLDNSACNLASLNLRKFQNEDGSIDIDSIVKAVRIVTTAMDILVDLAGYPSKEIARNSHDYRPLGVGFANLGALLMSKGLPYDSDLGRSYAGGIMSIINATAYCQSAELSKVKGPFNGFGTNAIEMLEVMRKHKDASKKLLADSIGPDGLPWDTELNTLLDDAVYMNELMLDNGSSYGFRNAQATVLAPTGTIAFMMGCDTTGIEPDLALIKYKLLAGEGEGMMKIINSTVEPALKNLGYEEYQIKEILQFIDENDTIEGAPGLRDVDLPVFDCAFKPENGERSIGYTGHIKMMAACQPFISGAISKTVNLPESASVEDIQDAYVLGWQLGLKAIAVYRENSKRSQPLSTSKDGNTRNTIKVDHEDLTAEIIDSALNLISKGLINNDLDEQAVINKLNLSRETKEVITSKPVRKRLPDERPSVTHKFSVAGHKGYMHVGLYPDTNMPGEIFITMSKQGSTMSGMLDAFATAVSVGLQYGVPIEDLCNKFKHTRFEPNGFTSNSEIRQATSIVDYLFNYIERKFVTDQVPTVYLPDLHKITMEPTFGDGEGSIEIPELSVPTPKFTSDEPVKLSITSTVQTQLDAPPCSNCGTITVRAGSCYSCPSCGSSTGCG